MKLNELSPSVPKKNRKRIGRGNSSGWGKTAGKGSNGQNSRAGGGVKPYFEGGQMPIQRRLPKYGFHNPFRVEYKAINISTLQALSEAKGLERITVENLIEAGFISKSQLVKVLANGELKSKLEVEAHAFSKAAQSAIEAVGGKAIKL